MALKKSWRIFVFLTKCEKKNCEGHAHSPSEEKKNTQRKKKRACKLSTSSFFLSHIFTNVLKLLTSLKKRLCTTIYSEKNGLKIT